MGLLDKALTAIKKISTKKKAGTVGTEIYDGWIESYEKNIEWQPELLVGNVNKMKREDPLIRGILSAYKMPILAGKSRIEPASEDAADMEVAELVENELLGKRWQQRMRDSLTFLDYGFAVLGKEFYVDEEGKYRYKNISMRMPETIKQFKHKPDATLDHIVQEAFDVGKQEFVTYEIPTTNFILFTNDMIGQDYLGTSILRPAWRAYTIKKLLLRVAAASLERWTMGVPIGRVDVSDESQIPPELKRTLEQISSHEKSYITATKSVDIDILQKPVDLTSLMDVVNYLDKEINTAISREFMSLGSAGGAGAFALSQTQEKGFNSACANTAKYVESVWNEGHDDQAHIKQLVDLNFNGVKEYPKLRIEPEQVSKVEQLLTELPGLVQAGFLTADTNTEAALRDKLDLPEMSDETIEERERIKVQKEEQANREPFGGFGNDDKTEEKKKQPKKKDEDKEKPEVENKASAIAPRVRMEAGPSEEFLELEEQIIDFDTIERRFEQEEDKLDEELALLLLLARKKLAEDIARIFRKTTNTAEMLEALENYPAPQRGNLAKAINKSSREMFDFGVSQVASEVKGQNIKIDTGLPKDTISKSKKGLAPYSRIPVSEYYDKVMAEVSRTTVAMKESGAYSPELIEEAIDRISTKRFKSDAAGNINGGYGLGRQETIEYVTVQDFDTKVFRSERLDSNICGPCSSIYGQEVKPGSELEKLTSTQWYQLCKGRTRCRGHNFVVIDG